MVGDAVSRPYQCLCGQPLHYTDLAVLGAVNVLIQQHGWYVRVTLPDEVEATGFPLPGGRGGKVTYLVPRHYIALHGLKPAEIRRLAEEGIIHTVPEGEGQ
jgi:hypothetical protein